MSLSLVNTSSNINDQCNEDAQDIKASDKRILSSIHWPNLFLANDKWLTTIEPSLYN